MIGREITVRLPPAVVGSLDRQAAIEGCTRAVLLRRIVFDWVTGFDECAQS